MIECPTLDCIIVDNFVSIFNDGDESGSTPNDDSSFNLIQKFDAGPRDVSRN